MAGVELVARFFDIQDADVGRQPLIERAQDFLRRREGALCRKRAHVRYLRDGMDTGIRAAGAVDFEVRTQEILGSLAELSLHGPGVVLLLPAAVFRSVVFERELPGFQFLSVRPRAGCYDERLGRRAMFKEFKEFIMRGNVLDLAVGHRHRRGVRKNRHVAGERYCDAAASGLFLGKVDFTNLFIDLSGRTPSNLAAAKAAGSRDHQLWVVPEYDGGFSDRGVRYFYRGQAGQQVEAAAGARIAHYQGMSVLPHDDSDSGHAVSELHVAVGVIP